MSAAGPHRTVAAVSLAVTAVIVVVMAIWGVNAATAPIDDDGGPVAAEPSDDALVCGPGETAVKITVLRADEVVVSVYNAGKRKGRATTTLNALENRGFQPGAIGNAADSGVQFVEVHTKESDATRAQLVALAFGPNAQVIVDDEKDLRGPGVNVLIGDKFRKLKTGAPRQVRLPAPNVVCR